MDPIKRLFVARENLFGAIEMSLWEEIILAPSELSIHGHFPLDQIEGIVARSSKKIIVQCDLLVTESKFKALTGLIQQLPPKISLRIKDKGLFYWALKNTSFNLQYLAEDGHHNLDALSALESTGGDRLESIALSAQIPRSQLQEMLKALNTPCEVLAIGPLSLFYSPRQLISNIGDQSGKSHITAKADSLESPHKGYHFFESVHGTVMYHLKDFSLLDHLDELTGFGVGAFRVDLTSCFLDSSVIFSVEQMESSKDLESLAQIYPRKTTKGYYLANKSDVLFDKIRSQATRRQFDRTPLGKVLSNNKADGCLVLLGPGQTLRLGDELEFARSHTEPLRIPVDEMFDYQLRPAIRLNSGDVLRIEYCKQVAINSNVFRANDQSVPNQS
jgi:hypothetical protein